ncbi:MAG: Enoyl-CoA hydratase/isomerase, partial [Actinomycetota bacterium]
MIRTETRDGIAHVIIDRPEKRNAMTYAMNAGFFAAIHHAGQDDAV